MSLALLSRERNLSLEVALQVRRSLNRQLAPNRAASRNILFSVLCFFESLSARLQTCPSVTHSIACGWQFRCIYFLEETTQEQELLGAFNMTDLERGLAEMWRLVESLAASQGGRAVNGNAAPSPDSDEPEDAEDPDDPDKPPKA